MTLLQKIILKIPVDFQKLLLKFLYAKTGYKLQDFRSYYNNKYFLYKVNGVYVPSASIGWFVHYGYYKDWVEEVAISFYSPSEGDIVIDIGSGMGEEALIFSEKVGDSGQVFCIEANPEAFEVLQDVVKLNNIKNIQLFNVAIYSENEPVKLEKNHITFLVGSLQLGFETSGNQYFSVLGTRLDSFVAIIGIKRIDRMKANIERAERFVIKIMGGILTMVGNVAISCHDFRYRYDGGNEFFKTKELGSNFLKGDSFTVHSLNTGVRTQGRLDFWN